MKRAKKESYERFGFEVEDQYKANRSFGTQ